MIVRSLRTHKIAGSLPIKSSFTVAFYGRTFFVELRITTLSANSSTEEKEKKKKEGTITLVAM
jgi:hypothetical protein